MEFDTSLIDKFLEGTLNPEESIAVLAAISANPKLEEYVVTKKRLDYATEQIDDYSSFIPANSSAADDGHNLCNLQCEAYILNAAGVKVSETELANESRKNYWLKSQGTPLFNMGKLLESKGYLARRVFGATFDTISFSLKDYSLIAVVNGDVLIGKEPDIFSDDFSLDNNPNHAVVILDVLNNTNKIRIFNPAEGESCKEYEIDTFKAAWAESNNYLVLVRPKHYPQEYIPQPVDVSDIPLNPELMELTEMIAENAHDVWAEARMKEGWTYGEVRDDTLKKHPDMVPYSCLPEGEKQYDRLMAMNTIKLVKRLGYRLVNITSMYKCPECGDVIEPNNNFCPNCGRQLSWEDFR